MAGLLGKHGNKWLGHGHLCGNEYRVGGVDYVVSETTKATAAAGAAAAGGAAGGGAAAAAAMAAAVIIRSPVHVSILMSWKHDRYRR